MIVHLLYYIKTFFNYFELLNLYYIKYNTVFLLLLFTVIFLYKNSIINFKKGNAIMTLFFKCIVLVSYCLINCLVLL